MFANEITTFILTHVLLSLSLFGSLPLPSVRIFTNTRVIVLDLQASD